MANVEVPGTDWSRLTKVDVVTKLVRENPHLTNREVQQQAQLRGHSVCFSTIHTARARAKGKPHSADAKAWRELGLLPQHRQSQSLPSPKPLEAIRDLIETVKTLKATIDKLGGLEQARELIELF